LPGRLLPSPCEWRVAVVLVNGQPLPCLLSLRGYSLKWYPAPCESRNHPKVCAIRRIYLSSSWERLSKSYELTVAVLFQPLTRSGQHPADPRCGRADFFHAGHPEVHRPEYGCGSFHEDWISPSVFRGALCGNV